MGERTPASNVKYASVRLGSLHEYLAQLDWIGARRDPVLFRGQGEILPLRPKIARSNSGFPGDTRHPEEREKGMLDAFKRQAVPFLKHEPANDWEWLALAQHHGMSTRLLDWSSNPLIALWFAVADLSADETKSECDAVVWGFVPGPADQQLWDDPFGAYREGGVRVFSPTHVSQRIRAQAGFFTAHRPKPGVADYEPLEEYKAETAQLHKMVIARDRRVQLRRDLNLLGVNEASIFPDMEGLCRHLSWLHSIES